MAQKLNSVCETKFPSPSSWKAKVRFLSAAQPTDQGTESVVLVVVVVVVGTHFISTEVQFFGA